MGRHRSSSRSGNNYNSSSSSLNNFDYHKSTNIHYIRNHNTKISYKKSSIFALIFLTFVMCCVLWTFIPEFIQYGAKVNGDKNQIFIKDKVNILTPAEEEKILNLFSKIYDTSGMPIALYTDDFSWKSNYDSIEIYSEELYYSLSYEEDRMIILFTTERINAFNDWEYDFYCGNRTQKCLSNLELDMLMSNFQKSISNQNLTRALDYSWNCIINDIAKTNIHWGFLPIILFICLFLSIFYIPILRNLNIIKSKSDYSTLILYSICPNCNASNDTQSENCLYCNTLLKVYDQNIGFIKPSNH